MSIKIEERNGLEGTKDNFQKLKKKSQVMEIRSSGQLKQNIKHS